jgi:hypothetical protein
MKTWQKPLGQDTLYLDYDVIVDQIERLNFKVLEKVESQGLPPYKDEDPFLIRIVAKKL